MSQRNPHQHERAQFFSLNATYRIAPDSTTEDLFEDLGCLLEAGLGALEASDQPEDGNFWASVYLLRQARAVYNEVGSRYVATDHLPPQAKKEPHG